MPTQPSKKTYKIRIAQDRVLGPLDFDRVKALVMKGRILGKEPTSVEPFQAWLPFGSIPELSELLLRKLERDTNKGGGNADNTNAIPPTKTIVRPEITKTNPKQEESPDLRDESYEMPTLLDIKSIAAKKERNPDLEITAPIENLENNLPVPAPVEENDGATKILTIDKIEEALVPFAPEEKELPQKRGIMALVRPKKPSGNKPAAPKRRLLSKNTALVLALGILLITIWQSQEEEAKDPNNLVPRRHAFPYIEVNVPPQMGLPNAAQSAELAEKGTQLLTSETPGAYIRAIRTFFYPAVAKNPANWEARALLASSYIRLSETVPRNRRLFETLEKLIFPGPPRSQWTPEYVSALAEYYQMLNRQDQAQEIVDAYLKVRPTPEVLYQRAKIAYERRELDTALAVIAKAIPPEKVQKANPRHLLLYATLLDRKGQREGALQNLQRLKKESLSYGPGILFYADFLLRNGKPKEAFQALRFINGRPDLLEGGQRAEGWVITARTFENLGMMEQAFRFAKAAYVGHYNHNEAEDLLFRIKSKLPKYQAAYSLIAAARQKEKAKEIDKALVLYIKALEQNRQDATPFLLLAKLYEGKGEVYEAIDRYQKALQETPEKPIEAALNLARIYLSRYDIDKAKTMVARADQMAVKSKDRLDQVLYLKALMLVRMHKPDLAEGFFEKALSRGSRFIDLYLQMGDAETEKKNEKLAEFYYSVALRYEPFNPKAMLGVALTRFHLDSPSRAVSFLKDKLNSQPNSAAIMTNLALIYLRSGDQLSGKNYLQNAIRSDSKYAEAFRLLGDLTKDEGNRQNDYSAKRHSYRYALASYEMYSKLAPNDPTGFKSTADLYFDIRDLGAAAKNYHKVLELTPNFPDVRLRLAQISRNGGDNTRAMSLLNEEIKINSQSDAAYVEKGNIFMAQKDFVQATKAFTEAAHINELNADALFGLGVVYHLQGGYDNALSLFARVIKLDPLKADVYWQMGLIYQKQNNRGKAAQAFTDYKGLVHDQALVNKAADKLRELSVK